MRFEVMLPNGAGFDIRLLWEVTPQAIGRLGGLVVPLDNKGPPTVFFTAAGKSWRVQRQQGHVTQ